MIQATTTLTRTARDALFAYGMRGEPVVMVNPWRDASPEQGDESCCWRLDARAWPVLKMEPDTVALARVRAAVEAAHREFIEDALDNHEDVLAAHANMYEALGMEAYGEAVQLLNRTPALAALPSGGAPNMMVVAAEADACSLLKFCLLNGASPDTATPAGYTALHAAISGKHTRAFNVLMKANANVNATQTDGWSVLGWAVQQRWDSVYQRLLDAGADRTAMTPLGLTVEDLARKVDTPLPDRPGRGRRKA